MKKLAIVTSHPIQYYAPWFAYLVNENKLRLKVFYLWNFGVTKKRDREFQQEIKWDIPLLEGYDYEFVPNISNNPGTQSFWGLQNPSLGRRVSEYKPDYVLLIGYNYASLYRFILEWNYRKIPLIFRGDSHNLFPGNGWKESLKRQFISLIYKRFAAILYVGKANYEYFCYHQVDPQKLFFAPHSVDNQRFFQQADIARQQASIWKQELGISEHHQVILFAGKFNSKKRPLDLLNAYLQANLSDVSLLFVGGGELETELRSQAKNHPYIYFAPFQNQRMMPRTYAIADLVVLPSYGKGETWGLAINEAMCLSRPVIVSNHVGCARDLIYSGKNGLVFPTGNIEALTNKLQQAFSDKERLTQWGNESRKIIVNYSYAQTTQGLMQSLDYLNNTI